MDKGFTDNTLVFFVNGIKVADDNVNPEWTLLTYLREKLRLCGTKMGCAEGGCGACTVMISKMDSKSKKVKHYSVNACLTPIGSVHGVSVTTVEGIGSTKTRLHPVQERLAKAHGSQCGFCTPGVVMSAYTLLRNVPNPSMEQIEDYLVGNLCRCTGYRPIIEGLRTFTINSSAGNGCGRADCCQLKSPSSALPNGHPGVCKDTHKVMNGDSDNGENTSKPIDGCSNGEKSDLFNGKDFAPYDPTQEVIFPPELKLNGAIQTETLVLRSPRMTFFRVTTLKDLVSLKGLHPVSKVVVGNTEVGVEMKFKNQEYPVIIHPVDIPELLQIEVADSFVDIGSAVPLSDLEAEFRKIVNQLKSHKTRSLECFLEMLKWFAGRQIRNVAGIGGNIMTGSPISDLIPILMAARAKLIFHNIDGKREIGIDENFYSGYRKNISGPQDVLVKVRIPFTSQNEFMKCYKQSRRRDDDIAIVNSAIKVNLDLETFRVNSLSLVFGGMGTTVVMATNTMKKLVGRTWNKELLELGTTSLIEEMKLDPSVPGGMAEYRTSLTASFFFKFYLSVCHELRRINPESYSLEADEEEMIRPYERLPVKSTQVFHDVSENQEKTDAVGRPIQHLSSDKQTTGEAVYTDDIPPLKDQLFGAFVLSERASAKILEIDPSEALKMNGVVDFISSKDLPGERNMTGCIVQDEEIFASEEVRCVGQIIGIVVALDPNIAQRSAKKVLVLYQDLPNPIFTIQDAIKAKSVWEPLVVESGNVEEALKTCDVTLEGEIKVGGQEHFYLETNVHIAIPHEDDEIELWSTSQSLSELHMLLGRALAIPSNRIKCKVKRIGGGFGGKQSRATSVALPVAVAAVKTGRPVRIVLDRDEDMLITGGRHPVLAKWKVGFDNDGTLKALDVNLYSNAGHSLDLSEPVMIKIVFNINNAYKIDNLRVRGQCCRTNLPSNTAFRGFGNPQTVFVMENIMANVAEYLNMDALKVREKNMYEDHSVPTTHFGQEIKNCLVRKCWNQVINSAQYRRRERLVQEYNRTNRYKKRGISATPLKFGVGFEITFLNQAGALILVYSDGSVLLSHGGMEMGQGLHTKMIQIASRALRIPVDSIYIADTSTDTVPNTSPSAASVSSDLNGMAVLDACEKIVNRLKPYRTKMPNGTWKEWVSAAYFDRVSLSATGFYKTPGLTEFNFKEPEASNPFNYFCFGAAISEVEIDSLTGDHTMLRTDIVMDVGKSLNPAIDIGQIEGAFIQGYGLFTLEQLLYTTSGELLTKGPGSYKIPSINDIPREFNVTLLKDSENERAVYSSKAVGEPPLLAAISVFMAIREAVKSSRGNVSEPNTVFRFDSPATAERIRMTCRDWITDQIPQNPSPHLNKWAMEL